MSTNASNTNQINKPANESSEGKSSNASQPSKQPQQNRIQQQQHQQQKQQQQQQQQHQVSPSILPINFSNNDPNQQLIFSAAAAALKQIGLLVIANMVQSQSNQNDDNNNARTSASTPSPATPNGREFPSYSTTASANITTDHHETQSDSEIVSSNQISEAEKYANLLTTMAYQYHPPYTQEQPDDHQITHSTKQHLLTQPTISNMATDDISKKPSASPHPTSNTTTTLHHSITPSQNQLNQNQQETQNSNRNYPYFNPSQHATASIPNTELNQYDSNTSSTTSNTTKSKVLSLEQDQYELSPYQCLVRTQMEVFEQPIPKNMHGKEDSTHGYQAGIVTQGRNRPILPGQVGIRCRHCGAATNRSCQGRGAILFPSNLLGVYQAAQNMANTHLLQTCKLIPAETREELLRIRSREKGKKTRKSAYGGGRQYWADSLSVLGVAESEDHRLYFSSSKNNVAFATASASSSSFPPSSKGS